MDKNILYTAIQAALAAGAEIMSVYTDPKADFEIEKKADNSPLTIADRKSHAIIAQALAVTPYPVLSEEGAKIAPEERQQWKELWVVDPLDGTKEFIKRNGEFTVNIAYVKNALIEQAERLPYANRTDDTFIIVASRSHLTPETEAYIHEMQQKHAHVETISKGSSLKLCLIAEGNADVYPRFAPTMEWDTAAGHAIIRAAGKEVYQAGKTEPLQYNKTDLLNPWFIAE